MSDIRQVKWCFLVDDSALLALGLALVALDDVYARDERARVTGINPQHFALLALVAPRGDDDAVALANFCGHHNTSGASEMIFMWFLLRSSRVTGPKIRVPIGSF